MQCETGSQSGLVRTSQSTQTLSCRTRSVGTNTKPLQGEDGEPLQGEDDGLKSAATTPSPAVTDIAPSAQKTQKMESVAWVIRRLVPEIPEEELASVVHYLKSEGYERGKDLVYLEAEDLKPHLKLFYIRKLLKGLKTYSFHEPSNSISSSLAQAEASASAVRSVSLVQASTSAAQSVSLAQAAASTLAVRSVSLLQGDASTSAVQFVGLPQEETSTSAVHSVVSVRPKTSQNWLQDFQINWPEFPAELLRDCENKRRPSPRMRRQLVKIIGTSIAKHDPSPGIVTVKHITRLVTWKYPKSFADLTSGGDLIGDGTASLSRQLATFLENRLRPYRSTKRESNDLSEEVQLPAKRFRGSMDSYGCVAWQPDCHPETWESLAEKRCLLLETSPYCKAEILKLMADTYPLQRKDINEKKLTAKNMRELWPYLLVESHFFNHLSTLVGLPFCETFVLGLTQKGRRIVDYMFKLSKSGMRTLLEKVTSAMDEEGQPVPRHYFVLELLCAFFGEDYTQVVSFHSDTAEGRLQGLPPTPHLAIIGSSLGEIHRVVLTVDGEECIYTTTLEKAMALLLGAFFVFNISYPAGCALTMEFLQRYFGEINPTKGKGKGHVALRQRTKIAPRLLSLLHAL